MPAVNLCMSRAPLRIGYVGGGSDLPGGEGSTFTCAIDKFVYCIAKKRHDNKIYLTWRNKEIVDSVDEIQHDIFRECLRVKGIEGGVEIMTLSDIPGVGSGLGSSGATTVAVLCALNALKGTSQTQHQIAREAAHLEMTLLGRSCGPQDAYISTWGGIRHFDYHLNGRVGVYRIDLTRHEKKKLEEAFTLFGPHVAQGDDKFIGRDSDSILSNFTQSDRFRESCIELCKEFQGFIRGHRWLRLGSVVQKHSDLKVEHFPGHAPEEIEALKETIPHFKLCGAGRTGFLLVPSHEVLDKKIFNRVSEIWGPKFDYKIFNGHADVVYSSEE